MLCKNSKIAVSEQIFSVNLKKIMSFDHCIVAQKKIAFDISIRNVERD